MFNGGDRAQYLKALVKLSRKLAEREGTSQKRRFLLLAFLFAPTSRKRKAANDLVRLTFKKGKPPLVRFPSLCFAQIHPFVALANA